MRTVRLIPSLFCGPLEVTCRWPRHIGGQRVPAGVELPGAVEILGLHQQRAGGIQCVQHVEFVLAAEIGHQRAAFGRRQGAVVDHHLGDLAVVTALRLVEFLSSEAIAVAALVAHGGVSRGIHLAIRAQGIAQAVLNLHGGTLAGRAEHDDGEAAIGGNVQGVVNIDFPLRAAIDQRR